MKYEIRDYQENTINKTLSTKENTIICLPTGGGKEYVILRIAQSYISRDKKVVIVLRSSVLIEQIDKALDDLNIEHSIIKDGFEYKGKANVTLIMEQTFYYRYEKLDINTNIDVLIKDEFHIATTKGKQSQLLLEVLQPKRLIGLSATPLDQKGNALNPDWYWVEETSTLQLMNLGYLKKPKWLLPRYSNLVSDNANKLEVSSTGDYTSKSIDLVVNTPEMNQMVVNDIKLLLEDNRKILVFCNSIKHIKDLSTMLNKNKIKHLIMHSKQKKETNNKNLQAYKDRKVSVMLNMSMLTTGFNDPETDAGIIIRPTKILSLAIQIIGRLCREFKALDKLLLDYPVDFSKKIAFIAKRDEDIELIKQQLQDKGRADIDILNSNDNITNYSNIEYKVQPNKRKPIIYDYSMFLQNFGFLEEIDNFKDMRQEKVGEKRIDEAPMLAGGTVDKQKIISFRLYDKTKKIDELINNVLILETKLKEKNKEIKILKQEMKQLEKIDNSIGKDKSIPFWNIPNLLDEERVELFKYIKDNFSNTNVTIKAIYTRSRNLDKNGELSYINLMSFLKWLHNQTLLSSRI